MNAEPTATVPAAPGGSTPLPNALLDALLPTLSDTELRVLLVVARSTLGWKQGSGRKGRDWLSHGQLQKRTGRSGAPVSRAVDCLVKRGLLVVQDEAGRERHSARERRALRSNLFFRLGDGLLQGALPCPPGTQLIRNQPTTLESKDGGDLEHAALAASTLQSEVENDPDRTVSPFSTSETDSGEVLPPSTTPQSEPVNPQDDTSTLESRLHFLKTTKEIQTKNRNKTLSSLPSQGANEESKDEPGHREEEQPWEKQTRRFLNLFERAYCTARPDDVAAPPDEEDLALLHNYFERGYGEKLEKWLPAFFKCSYGFVKRRHYSLHAYLHCFFILQVHAGAIGIKTM